MTKVDGNSLFNKNVHPAILNNTKAKSETKKEVKNDTLAIVNRDVTVPVRTNKTDYGIRIAQPERTLRESREKASDFNKFTEETNLILNKARKVIAGYKNYVAAKENIRTTFGERRIKQLCEIAVKDAQVLDSNTEILPLPRLHIPSGHHSEEKMFLQRRKRLQELIVGLKKDLDNYIVKKLDKILLLIDGNPRNDTDEIPKFLTSKHCLDITYEQHTKARLSPYIQKNINRLITLVDNIFDSLEKIGYMSELDEETLFSTHKKSKIALVCEIINDPGSVYGLWINFKEAAKEVKKNKST